MVKNDHHWQRLYNGERYLYIFTLLDGKNVQKSPISEYEISVQPFNLVQALTFL